MVLAAAVMKAAVVSLTALRDEEVGVCTCKQGKGMMRATASAAWRRELRLRFL